MAEPAKAKTVELFPEAKGKVVTRLVLKEGGIDVGGMTRTSISANKGALPPVRMELSEALGSVWVRYIEQGQLKSELVPLSNVRQASVVE